jgi:hypothetical protein
MLMEHIEIEPSMLPEAIRLSLRIIKDIIDWEWMVVSFISSVMCFMGCVLLGELLFS